MFIGRRDLAWPIAFIASAASFVIAGMLLSQVIDGSVISYQLGGWAPPLGIEYRVDTANAFVLLLVSGISTLVLPYAKASVARELPESAQDAVLRAVFCFVSRGFWALRLQAMPSMCLCFWKSHRSLPTC